jgi:hypothetical protein
MAERGDYHASYERAEVCEMDKAADDFLDPRSHALNLLGPLPPQPGNGCELLMLTSIQRKCDPEPRPTCEEARDPGSTSRSERS